MNETLVAFSCKRLAELDFELRFALNYSKLVELISVQTESTGIREAYQEISMYLEDARRKMHNSDQAVKKWIEAFTDFLLFLEVKIGKFTQDADISQELSQIANKMIVLQTDTKTNLCLQRRRSEYQYAVSKNCGRLDLVRDALHVRVQDLYVDEVFKFLKQEKGEVGIVIHGMAGTGKSTVASLACDKARRYFKYFAWIPASGLSHEIDVIRAVIRVFSIPDTSGEDDHSHKSNLVHKFLAGNKYLMVLDGMENSNFMSHVIRKFPKADGKVVITTCAHNNLLNLDHAQTLEVQVLPREAAREFLDSKARPPSDSSDVSDEIVSESSGSLMGLAIVGSLLSIRKTREGWQEVLNQVRELPDSAEEKVNGFVSIGYADLPPILKACFVYSCVLFSHTCDISKTKLIRMWIAQGLIDHTKNWYQEGTTSSDAIMTVEKIAERQLNELIYRNMVQVSEVGDDGVVKKCRLLEPIRKFAMEKHSGARSSNFSKSRWWQMRNKYKATTITQSNTKQLPNQQWLIRKVEQPYNHLSAGKFKKLQVLDLQYIKSIKTLGDDQVLANLLLLQYLSLRGTRIANLPSSLWKLKCLQTLDIRHTKVPNLTCNGSLAELRHLLLAESHVNRVVKLLQSQQLLSSSTKLQTLTGVEMTSNLDIGHLTQLQKLSIGGITAQNLDTLRDSIRKMKCLRSLALKCDDRFKPLAINSPHDFLELPKTLVKLTVRGFNKGLLTWIGTLTSLVTLEIWDTDLSDDPLSTLCKLPSLVRLTLSDAYAGKKIGSIQEDGFPSLKYLSIVSLEKLVWWEEIKKGAMKMLHKLTIIQCPKLKAVPQGLEHIIFRGFLTVHVNYEDDLPEEFMISISQLGPPVHLIPKMKKIELDKKL